jgi:hypothetical protein
MANDDKNKKSERSAWIGWGVTTLLTYFINKAMTDSVTEDSDRLSVNQTAIGTPIPFIIGRHMIKDSLIAYYGDFSASPYTETYGASSKFSAWSMILGEVALLLSEPVTGAAAAPHTHTVSAQVIGNPYGGRIQSFTDQERPTAPLPIKETKTGEMLLYFAQWLFGYLINKFMLKTTIQKGFKYYLGYQYIWCFSEENIRLRAIYMNKYFDDSDGMAAESEMSAVWTGDVSREDHLTAPYVINIDSPDLFGGVDEGGGFSGDIKVYFGGKQQGTDPWMVSQMNQSTIASDLRGLTPAYRPFVSTVTPTAYVGKSATLPEMWLEFQWIPNYLGLGGIGDDANAAEAIFAIYTNKKWGAGKDPNELDNSSLIEIGTTLKKEELGISIEQSSRTTADDMITSILDHINGTMFKEPSTGKWAFKLIREITDYSGVIELNESNCSDIEVTRADWQETVDEIAVTYTDRNDLYEQSTVNDADPALIEINNSEKTTKTYSYGYFTNSANAIYAAKREGKSQGYPLASCQMKGNRSLSNIRKGEVVKCTFEAFGISNMYCRVTDVQIGDFISGEVKISVVEDIFSLPKTVYSYDGSSNWNTEKTTPTGVSNYLFLEMPRQLTYETNTNVYAFANQPDNKTIKWNIWRNKGQEWTESNSSIKWTKTGQLVYDYAELGDSLDNTGIEILNKGGMDNLINSDISGESSARSGGKVILIDDELIAFSNFSVLANGNYLLTGLIRGIYDTVPQKHNAGTILYFVENGNISNVTGGGKVCSSGYITNEIYTITTASNDTEEEFSTTKARDVMTTRRSERQTPPGKFRISDLNNTSLKKIDEPIGDLIINYEYRDIETNKGILSQDDIQDYYSGNSFVLPNNTTYLLEVYAATTKIAEYIDTTKEIKYSWQQRCLDSSDLDSETIIKLWSVRNELKSNQCHERTMNWKRPSMVDAITSETEITARLQAWASTKIIIPENDYTIQRDIEFSELPIFVFGVIGTKNTVGSILNYDGNYIVPNGKIAIVTSPTQYSIIDIEKGYGFRTYFSTDSSTYINYIY